MHNHYRKLGKYISLLILATIGVGFAFAEDTGSCFYGTCYQESANVSTSCGGLATGTYGFQNVVSNVSTAYMYVNYTKPAHAQQPTSKWQYHMGINAINNATIGVNCWNQNPIQIRMYSSFNATFCASGRSACSGADCWTGSAWTSVVAKSGSGLTITQTASNISNLTDGNFNTGANYINGWNRFSTGNTGGNIYEEAMYWSIKPATLTINTSDNCNVTNLNDLNIFGINFIGNGTVNFNNVTLLGLKTAFKRTDSPTGQYSHFYLYNSQLVLTMNTIGGGGDSSTTGGGEES